jgi:hypothetical protein
MHDGRCRSPCRREGLVLDAWSSARVTGRLPNACPAGSRGSSRGASRADPDKLTRITGVAMAALRHAVCGDLKTDGSEWTAATRNGRLSLYGHDGARWLSVATLYASIPTKPHLPCDSPLVSYSFRARPPRQPRAHASRALGLLVSRTDGREVCLNLIDTRKKGSARPPTLSGSKRDARMVGRKRIGSARSVKRLETCPTERTHPWMTKKKS